MTDTQPIERTKSREKGKEPDKGREVVYATSVELDLPLCHEWATDTNNTQNGHKLNIELLEI